MKGFTRQHRSLWLALALVWLIAAGAGLAVLAGYANGPGAAAQAPSQWPAASTLVRDTARPTLVMVLHPLCDCSRASLAELRELVARAPQRAKIIAVFIHPEGVSDDWDQTGLWRAARQIPGAVLIRDDGGREAARFGAATSGQTLLYDEAGRLVFSGGTTIARGHEGDNPGLAALVSLLRAGESDRQATPVFGCPLFTPPSEG